MNKLIKVSDDHYIIVDDSEIKEGDWFWTPIKKSIEQCVKKLLIIKGGQNDIEQFKITHSTKPLENKFSSVIYGGYNPIFLPEVEELIYGYNVKKMAEQKWPVSMEDFNTEIIDGNAYFRGIWVMGFNFHRQFTKDKLFTIDDLRNSLLELIKDVSCEDGSLLGKSPVEALRWIENHIQTLIPKTEWDIKFEQGKLKLINHENRITNL